MQMDLALPPQDQLMGLGLMRQGQRRILIRELGERSRQLDLVVAVGDVESEREQRRERLRPGLRHLRLAGARQQAAGRHLLHALQGDDFAGARAGQLGHLVALEAGNPAHPHAAEGCALAELAGENPGQRQLAGMGHVIGLEDLGDVVGLVRNQAETRRRGFRPRHLVAQRFQQAAHAMVAISRAEEDRHDQIAGQILGQLLIDLVLRGDRILEQLLQQLVVEIGEGFQHPAARFLLAGRGLFRHLDQVRSLAGLVVVGAFAHQIDIAGHRLGARFSGRAQRHLAQHQRPR